MENSPPLIFRQVNASGSRWSPHTSKIVQSTFLMNGHATRIRNLSIYSMPSCSSTLRRAAKTILAITHDDTYFGFADRIVKLEDGACRGLEVRRPRARAGMIYSPAAMPPCWEKDVATELSRFWAVVHRCRLTRYPRLLQGAGVTTTTWADGRQKSTRHRACSRR
jgi:hypothetical protein